MYLAKYLCVLYYKHFCDWYNIHNIKSLPNVCAMYISSTCTILTKWYIVSFVSLHLQSRELFCQLVQLMKNQHSKNELKTQVRIFIGTWNMGRTFVNCDVSNPKEITYLRGKPNLERSFNNLFRLSLISDPSSII